MGNATEAVLPELLAERRRQAARWGQTDHAPSTRLMVLAQEVGAANQALLEHLFPGDDRQPRVRGLRGLDDYRREPLQAAGAADLSSSA
ncbi:hypothetical protein GCM10010840_01850 [Deinococcus aerolatus]|uniref:Uncharacterized protein n=1 Tax=Deinococcus aerolatus TaxID=522487 RepID=A0ABQ2FZL7_9DEIO|nr:hypothetical protein [Deinococcus aerolatus]GGL67472.1 hypothetical protein GCM10010840_01850 [Deinococcus aerolatus]